MSNALTEKEQVLGICKLLSDKKAADIVAIDVADKTIIAEWFVVCNGTSVTHVKTLCETVEEKCNELGLAVRRVEGYQEGRWIVIDFGHILVHVFHPDERIYYNMERLWMDEGKNYIAYSEEYDK